MDTMINDRFRGSMYVKDDNQLIAFQTAALTTGCSLSITPLGDGEYRLEFFIDDEISR